jgi:hypothetical protein
MLIFNPTLIWLFTTEDINAFTYSENFTFTQGIILIKKRNLKGIPHWFQYGVKHHAHPLNGVLYALQLLLCGALMWLMFLTTKTSLMSQCNLNPECSFNFCSTNSFILINKK